MAARGRSASQRKHPREKVVQLYESIFRGEAVCSEPDSFWHELLLLRPHVPTLQSELLRLSTDQLQLLATSSLHQLSARCVRAIEGRPLIPCAHALQTLTALMVGVCVRFRAEPASLCKSPILLLMAESDVHQQAAALSRRCCELVQLVHAPVQLKQLCLQQLLALVLLEEQLVVQHVLGGHEQLVLVLLQLLAGCDSRAVLGDDCLLLVTLLLSWRRCGGGGVNPCRSQLSALEDELVLNGLSQVMTARLAEFNLCHAENAAGDGRQRSGWLASITSAVGSVFSASDERTGGAALAVDADALVRNWTVLLALYEAVLLSRAFLSTLTQAATDTTSHSSSPRDSLDRKAVPPATLLENTPPPANLLSALIEFCSLTMRQTSTPVARHSVRLCFTVLTCVVEDHYCNSLLHDANLVFTVHVHRVAMRHRRASPPTTVSARGLQPLCVWLLELAMEFMVSHLVQRLPVDLYRQCVGIVHRLLCYQKHCRVRLAFQWRHLWSALVALLRFVVAHEQLLCDVDGAVEPSGATEARWPRASVLELCAAVVNIFNLFITYGDTFLSTPVCYDELYYELVRDAHVFSSLYALSVRHASDATLEQGAITAAGHLSACLVNIRAIGNHFAPKIDAWLAESGAASASEGQVLELVRNNYESLTLKLQQSLDMYTAHAETAEFVELYDSLLGQTRTLHAERMYELPLEVDHGLLTSQLSCIN